MYSASESTQQARRHIAQLEQSVNTVMTSDPNLSTRMAAFSIQHDTNFDASSIHSVSTVSTLKNLHTSVAFTFERALAKACVYQKAAGNTSTRSFRTLNTSESKWSQISGLSLSEISNISVIYLPVYTNELHNNNFFDHDAKSNDGLRVLHVAAAKEHSTTVQLVRSIMLARDLARWLLWRMGAYSPQRPKAAGMRPVACGPHAEE